MTVRAEFLSVLVCLMAAGLAPGQATRPAEDGRLNYRAGRAFDLGDYATALPLLQKLSYELKDKPSKLNVVLERIRICEQNLAATTTQPSEGPRTPHHRPPAGQVLDLSIKDLGNFDYDQDTGDNIPDDVKQLNGCKIRLKGYMMPIDQSVHITQFALVPSLFGCCFGQPPQIQHTVVVICPKGMQTEFSTDQVAVEGTLTVQEKRDDGYIVSIFEVSVNSIKAVPN